MNILIIMIFAVGLFLATFTICMQYLATKEFLNRIRERGQIVDVAFSGDIANDEFFREIESAIEKCVRQV